MGALQHGGISARLAAALARLDRLVDWERRDRSAAALQSMRVDLGAARALLGRLETARGGALGRRAAVVHIAGSKGKGTAAKAVEAAGLAAGLRVGRYGSPHVERIHERVQVNGRDVLDDDLAAGLEAALAALDGERAAGGPGAEATWFDVLSLAAFDVFERADLDLWVVEVGLGGRLDSTNVLDGDVCVVTGIELEHTAILGDTRAAIAAEKAGILKPGAAVVTGLTRPGSAASGDDPASRVLEERARALGLAVDWRPPVPGDSFEDRARALAAGVFEALGARGRTGADGAPLRGGLALGLSDRAIALPGRWERFEVDGVPVVLDGAHVPASLALLRRRLEADGSLLGSPVVVFGAGLDKDLAGLLKVFVGWADRVLCSSAGAGPYLSPEVLAAKAREFGLGAENVPDPRMAVQRALAVAQGRWVLVTGSLHLCGAVRAGLPVAARPSPC